MSVERNLPIQAASWPLAVFVHAKRLVKRWLRSSTMIFVTLGMPIISMVVMVVMFKGMIEQITRDNLNITGMTLMIAVASMFTGALMGAGSTVQERHEGLMDRLDTFPGYRSTAYVGRILAETLRALIACLSSLGVGVTFGADFGTPVQTLKLVLLLASVAVCAGITGVVMGYAADTPQGAVGFAPVIMAAMFFNTAMMPTEMYAEVLRPAVDHSPITAVAKLGNDILTDSFAAAHLWLFVIWFAGLSVLGVAVMFYKARRR